MAPFGRGSARGGIVRGAPMVLPGMDAGIRGRAPPDPGRRSERPGWRNRAGFQEGNGGGPNACVHRAAPDGFRNGAHSIDPLHRMRGQDPRSVKSQWERVQMRYHAFILVRKLRQTIRRAGMHAVCEPPHTETLRDQAETLFRLCPAGQSPSGERRAELPEGFRRDGGFRREDSPILRDGG